MVREPENKSPSHQGGGSEGVKSPREAQTKIPPFAGKNNIIFHSHMYRVQAKSLLSSVVQTLHEDITKVLPTVQCVAHMKWAGTLPRRGGAQRILGERTPCLEGGALFVELCAYPQNVVREEFPPGWKRHAALFASTLPRAPSMPRYGRAFSACALANSASSFVALEPLRKSIICCCACSSRCSRAVWMDTSWSFSEWNSWLSLGAFDPD